MKQIMTTLILALTFGLQYSNAQQKEITETYENYIESTKSDNLDDQLEYYHPAIFTYYPRDTFLLAFEMIKANLMYKVGNERLVSISEVLPLTILSMLW